MWGIPLPGWTEVQQMSSVKENIRKIKVLAALIAVNILKHNWRSMNWWIIVSNGRVSEEEYYISGSLVVIIVYGQQPPRSWSTIKIGCHYSPQSLSTAAIRIHHQLPPWSGSTTTVRCQQDTGSAITIKISESTIIIHDVVAAVPLDLRTLRQRDSGEEVKSVTCIDEILISFMWSGWRRGRRSWKECVMCPPDILDL